MKKTIISFTAGQLLQLIILEIGQSLTYTSNIVPFCAAIGAVVTLALLIGSAGQMLELAYIAENEDEDAEIKMGEPLKDEELTTIFRRGDDEK